MWYIREGPCKRSLDIRTDLHGMTVFDLDKKEAKEISVEFTGRCYIRLCALSI